MWVKLDDEEGAAGLVFAADGGDRHYGFYPTAGKLRLTRFDGPDVLSWKILEEADSPDYLPGAWNHLRVRRTADGFACFLNDAKVFESTDKGLGEGKVGLAKFRDTYFVANNMVVAVVGNVRHEEAFPKIAAAFADMRSAPKPSFHPAPPPRAQARRVDGTAPGQQSPWCSLRCSTQPSRETCR